MALSLASRIAIEVTHVNAHTVFPIYHIRIHVVVHCAHMHTHLSVDIRINCLNSQTGSTLDLRPLVPNPIEPLSEGCSIFHFASLAIKCFYTHCHMLTNTIKFISLFQAEDFNDAVQIVREWLPHAEAELKFRALPEDEEAISVLIDQHEVS